MRYNLSKIMLKAWSIYRKEGDLPFGECLHRAWLSAKAEGENAQRIEAAKARDKRGDGHLERLEGAGL